MVTDDVDVKRLRASARLQERKIKRRTHGYEARILRGD